MIQDKRIITTSFMNAHGKIPYGMTNDYMFRAVLQSNNKVLRALICSLLHLSDDEVRSVKITNTIILGKTITEKEMRLDINLVLNNNTIVNLEMQVANKLNWTNRSIFYICRSFVSQLKRGQDYHKAKPAIHIGFLDYTLFEEYPEFYAIHKLINVKNHHVYSDNLTLCVVDLSRIDLATDDDKKYHIDEWATLFKAKTWEDLKMLSTKNEYFKEASETIFEMCTDEDIQKICQDREDYYSDIRHFQLTIKNMYKTISKQKNKLKRQRKKLDKKDEVLAKKDNELATQKATIDQLLAEIQLLKNKK